MAHGRLGGLARACHLGPSLAVTALAGAYAISVGLTPGRVVLVSAAVLTGQLSIGWGNDLIDRGRDRTVGRLDKPLAAGTLPTSDAAAACGAALVATVVLSLACGLAAGVVHLACVAAGWSYNLGVKSTLLSWLPFAAAFGGLPAVVILTGNADAPLPWSVLVAGALLGVGAHLMNVLPDLTGDEATGVRGLAHRLGARRATLLALACLVAASVVLLRGARPVPTGVLLVVVAAIAMLAALVLLGRGKVPFRAVIGIALADVLLLVVAA